MASDTNVAHTGAIAPAADPTTAGPVGGPPQTGQPEVLPSESGTFGTPNPPRRSRPKTKGSRHDMIYGRRKSRSFPVTFSELWQLFAFGLLANLCFAIGAESVKFNLEVYKDLQLNVGLSRDIITHWEKIRTYCTIAAWISFIVGFVFVFFGGAKIFEIKAQTEFEE